MPVFPFRTRVGDDLRALFKHDRLEAQSDRLGQSSIDPGGGVLEVRDAAGNAVAGLGHVGGRMGLLIREGGSWKSMGEFVSEKVGEGTSGLQSRVSAAETDIYNLQQTRVTQAVHNALAGRVGAAETDISTLQTTKASQSSHNILAGRVGALENKMNEVISTLNTVIDRVGWKAGSTPPPPVNPMTT